MTIKELASMMFETEEAEYICIETADSLVTYVGTLADLRRNHPKALSRNVERIYTDRLFDKYGLTIVI
jgi:hypothetical protein